MIWAYLIHLGYNMWIDREDPKLEGYLASVIAKPYMRLDKPVWDDLLTRIAEAGANMVLVDLAEGVKYDSHPEIAVADAWTIDALRAELAKMRDMGLEPIPKMNFSATHDAWLGPYSRCLSTPAYYGLCRDLIREAIDIFDGPRLFHLGMDEETAGHQRYHQYVVIRQYDLWWHDLAFYVNEVEKKGARAWVWSDYLWHHPEMFFANMPKTVLQSNWYYGDNFDLEDNPEAAYPKAYLDLEEHGYDQAPTGGNFVVPTNFGGTVRFCREHIAPDRLAGFIQTVWRPTTEEYRRRHIEAIDQLREARAWFEGAAG